MTDADEKVINLLFDKNIYSEKEILKIIDNQLEDIDVLYVFRIISFRLIFKNKTRIKGKLIFNNETKGIGMELLQGNTLRDDPRSNFILGEIYYFDQEYLLAEEKYIFCVENQQYLRVYNLLGRIYYFGLGVPRDLIKAKQYFLKGAECGYLYSKKFLLQIDYSLSPCSPFSIVKLWLKHNFLRIKGVFICIHNIEDERLVHIIDVPFKSNRKT